MYSFGQLTKGLRQPTLAKREIRRRYQRFRTYLPHDVGIQGSYDLGNIGDLALGEQFQYQIEQLGYSTQLFGKNVESSSAHHRILGGGGVLHDWYGTDHLRRRFNYVTGGETGCAIGVGVPGFHTDEGKRLAARVLPELDAITVRDEWSKQNVEAVCDADVEVTACPAFLYEDPNAGSSGGTGVNFRPYYGEENKPDRVLRNYFGYEDLKNAQERYLENIHSICDRVEDPVFIPFHQKDETFARNNLDIPIAKYEFSVERTLRRVSSVDRMVATRYHSLIFAAICGLPILPLAYEPKVKAVAERLGLPHYEPLADGEIPLEFTQGTNIDSLRERSKENFAILSDTISDA